MSEEQKQPETKQELEQAYAQLAMRHGDMLYRAECFKEDAAKVFAEMKKLSQKAFELSVKEQQAAESANKEQQ